MSWLLDTNAVSELLRKRMDGGFDAWWKLASANDAGIYLCAPVIGEITYGAARPDISSHKRREILKWLDEELVPRFEGRILPFDEAVARTWGELAWKIPRGRALPIVDSYIAAIAIHHDLTLITRDIVDMSLFKDLRIESPWA